MTTEDWALARHLRLAKQLGRAMQIYIARTTSLRDWAHYRNDCNVAERPTVRPPRHLEELEQILLAHLPKRAVLWGVCETVEAHQRKIAQIVEQLTKENK